MTHPLDIVVFGLSLSSSWGNGHATTFRALIGGLSELGHKVLFLERDQPWYASNRDLPDPGFCDLALYDSLDEVLEQHAGRIADADAVVVGSYVPDAIDLIDRVERRVRGRLHFYDIDTPVTLDHLARGNAPYLARRQVPLFETVFSFAGGQALQELESHLGARRACALYCSVDPSLYPALERTHSWDLGYIGTHSDDRLPGLEALLLAPARMRPDLHFVVAGPQYPGSIDWPANVERIEHLPPAGHAAFYAAQRFTLNLTRAPMRRLGHSPSVRLFEAGSCATTVISDPWPGLAELMPEVIVARGPQDVLSALARDNEETYRLGRAARRRVLALHTGRARAETMVRELMQHAGQPTG